MSLKSDGIKAAFKAMEGVPTEVILLRAEVAALKAECARYREAVSQMVLRCRGFASWAAERGDKKTKETWEREATHLEAALADGTGEIKD